MAYSQVLAAASGDVNVGAGGPGPSIDGVGLANLDRVLLTRQNTPSQNGVWVFDTAITAMSRPSAPDPYVGGGNFDNATLIWVTAGDTLAGTVWGIEPATRVTVNTTAHTLTRVSLPPVQCRVATTENITIGGTHLILDGTSVNDGAMTNASGTLTCATSKPFRASDVGKRVIVAGAAAGPVDLVAIITAYTNESVVTISPGCTYGPGVAAANVTFGVAIVGDGTAGSDIVLVKDQTAREKNGLYWAKTTGAMVPCSEPVVPGRAMVVSEGAKNQHRRFRVANQGPITFDGTDVTIALESLVLNPMDFGAACDLATDDSDALQRTIDAAKTLGNDSGATIMIPSPGCFCDKTVIVDANILLTGQANAATSVTGTAPSKLIFSEGHCLVLQARATPTTRGEGATVRDLHVGTTAIAGITNWSYDTPYAEGDRVFMPWDRRYFYECLEAGTSQSRPAAAPAWLPGQPYTEGDFVTPPDPPDGVGANGHMYKCKNTGTSGAVAPSHWIYGTEWTDDNDLTWKVQVPDSSDPTHPEYHPDFPQNPIRYGAVGSELSWAQDIYYRTGDVVIARDAGDVVIDDRIFVLISASGTSGAGPALGGWDVLVDVEVEDGNLTWVCKPNTVGGAPLYMIRDNDLLWIACCCPAIALRCVSSLERAYAFGATNASVHLQAGSPAAGADGPYPVANANHCTWNQVACNGSPLGVCVKGNDSSGGLASGVTVIGNGTLPPEEWDVGIHDGTFFGWTWVGCRVETSNGYPFIANSDVGHSTFAGCYREVAIPDEPPWDETPNLRRRTALTPGLSSAATAWPRAGSSPRSTASVR